jgi:hypothetical protein
MTSKKRGPPKGYIDAIELRLKRMEELIKTIVQMDKGLATRISSAMANIRQGNYEEAVTEMSYLDYEAHQYLFTKAAVQTPTSDDQTTKFQFPPEKELRRLVEVYFDALHPMLPIVGKERFQKRLEVFCTSHKGYEAQAPGKQSLSFMMNPDGQEDYFTPRNALEELATSSLSDPKFELLLCAMLAHACHYDKDTTTRSDDYAMRARHLLKDSYDMCSLDTLQSLLLMSLYYFPTSNYCWQLSGMAIRMAQDMYVDRKYWRLSLDGSLDHLVDTRQEPQELREQQFIREACVLVDRIVGIGMGRTVAFDDTDAAREAAPSDHFAPSWNSLIYLMHVTGQVWRMTVCLRGCKDYSAGSDEVCVQIRTQQRTYKERLNVKLQEWRIYENLRLSNSQRKNSTFVGELDIWIELLYHTCRILLHRPWVMEKREMERWQTKDTGMEPIDAVSDWQEGQDVCLESAQCIARIAEAMTKQSRQSCMDSLLELCLTTAAVIFLRASLSFSTPDTTKQEQGAGKSFARMLDLLRKRHKLTWTCGYLGEISHYYTTLAARSHLQSTPTNLVCIEHMYWSCPVGLDNRLWETYMHELSQLDTLFH